MLKGLKMLPMLSICPECGHKVQIPVFDGEVFEIRSTHRHPVMPSKKDIINEIFTTGLIPTPQSHEVKCAILVFPRVGVN